MSEQVDPPEIKDFYSKQYAAYTKEDAQIDNCGEAFRILVNCNSPKENMEKFEAFIEQARRDYADKWRGEDPSE